MSTAVTYNGVAYTIPAVGDASWGVGLSSYLVALATGSLTKAGGAFTLTSEIDFGATYGLKAVYLKSKTVNPAAAGAVRLAQVDTVSWRNNANGADLALAVVSDVLKFNGVTLATAGVGSIVNADISASAAIAYSKLALTGAILNADLAGSIAYSKLSLTGAILNADLAGSIAYSKLSLAGSIATADIASGLVLSAANGGTGVANNAAATLTRSGNHAVTLTTTNTTSVTLPTAGTLATLAGAEVITNKDHDGGTASNTSRLTVPKAALSTLTALTRKQGTLVYDTTANALLADDGSNLNAIGSGSGEKNYITAPSTASAWTATGTITATTVTTGLPRPTTTKTGVSFAVGAAADYAYARFTLDDADFNKKLKVQFDQVELVGTDWKVDVYSNTLVGYNGTSTRLSLSTDSSAVSLLPGLTGTFRTTFDAPGSAAKYIEVRIVRVANASALVLSDVVVGPGVVVQGAAVSEAVSWTPTGSWTTNTTYTGQFWRIGSRIRCYVKVALAGAPNAATNLSINMPISPALTINSSLVDTTIYAGNFGNGQALHSGASLTFQVVGGGSTTAVAVEYQANITAGNGPASTTAPVTWGAGDTLEFWWEVPVNEYAGAGTVNVVQNDVEYAYNTTSNDADDTTSFGYGPTGGTIGSFTAARNKRVRFLTPISATDKLELEINSGSGNGNAWLPLYQTRTGNLSYQNQNGVLYGVGIVEQANGTDVDIQFETYAKATGATYGAAGAAWSTVAGYQWRVKKSRGGQAVGFSEVVPGTSSGLVGAAGLKGNTTGNAIATGYVGEMLGTIRSGVNGATYDTTTTTAITTSVANIATLTLNKGLYIISGFLKFLPSAGGITYAANWTAGGTTIQGAQSTITPASSVPVNLVLPTMPLYIAADGTVLAISASVGAGTTSAETNSIYAVRIA